MSSTHFTASPPPAFDEDAPRRPSFAPRVWAGALLLLTGLGLILLGGCFMIGAVVMVRPDFFNVSPSSGPEPPPTWDALAIFLFSVLNVLTFACLLGAVVLFLFGFLGLYRILFGHAKDHA